MPHCSIGSSLHQSYLMLKMKKHRARNLMSLMATLAPFKELLGRKLASPTNENDSRKPAASHPVQ
jgi:hypothetical protein